MSRRYGNVPGLLMALFIVGFAGVLLLVYPSGWEHRAVTLVAVTIGVLVVWHWRPYYREVRALARRRG
jgi:ABC-type dipeptide/oligopeptide/nickel transport system permease subunit